MPLKIEVTSEVKSRNVKNYVFRAQIGHAMLPGKKYPTEISIPLPREREPYAPGVYTISDESFSPNTEYGETRLQFALVLQPMASGVAKTA